MIVRVYKNTPLSVSRGVVIYPSSPDLCGRCGSAEQCRPSSGQEGEAEGLGLLSLFGLYLNQESISWMTVLSICEFLSLYS